jgi:hypothetical protein
MEHARVVEVEMSDGTFRWEVQYRTFWFFWQTSIMSPYTNMNAALDAARIWNEYKNRHKSPRPRPVSRKVLTESVKPRNLAYEKLIQRWYRNNMLDKYELKEFLEGNVATVVFKKVDGTERKMRCTLKNQFLAEHDGQDKHADILAVWDLDNDAWRSFHVSSVKEIIQE